MEKVDDVGKNMEYDSLLKQLEYYKRQTNEQVLQVDRTTATELTADLVSMFGQQIIFPKMENVYRGSLSFESFKDLRRYISLSYLTHLEKKRKEGIDQLMICMEEIAECYHITRNQWQVLVSINIREPNVSTGEQPIDEIDIQRLEQLATKENVLKSSLSNAVSSLIAAIRQWKNEENRKDYGSDILTPPSVEPASLPALKETNEENQSVDAVNHEYARQNAKYSGPYSPRQPRLTKFKPDRKGWRMIKRVKRDNQINHIQECDVH
jgi:hypothetical protein